MNRRQFLRSLPVIALVPLAGVPAKVKQPKQLVAPLPRVAHGDWITAEFMNSIVDTCNRLSGFGPDAGKPE